MHSTHESAPRRRGARARRTAAVVAVPAALALVAAGCSSSSGEGDGDAVTITIAGPNQWNNDPASFGPAWEGLVERFEAAEPGIDVETTVLPLSQFQQTLSTQLSAGTAPELVFAQAPHTPDQVHSLTEYLDEPNPYAEGNEKWVDLFDQGYFGPDSAKGTNAKGEREFVPLNMLILGVYYNQDILDEAGVTAPIETWGDMLDACGAITDAGYVPFAMDGGKLGQGWTFQAINSMLMDKYADDWNQFGADGEPGTTDPVSDKSIAKAMLTDDLSATGTPEVAETLTLLKTFFDECATPNWSGISGGAAFVGQDDFLGGRAAMAWGTSFATGNLEDVSWGWGAMPFPTITSQDSEVSDDTPARYGPRIGGTNYMIPSTTEGEKLDAAIKFLQYVTSPEGGQQWIDESGAISSLEGGDAAPGLEDLMAGDWAELPNIDNIALAPKEQAGKAVLDGYLLGSKDLDAQLTELEDNWNRWATELAAEGGWTEDWAQQ